MLKWAISFAVNRALILAAIVLAINTYSPSSCQIGAHLTDWLSSVTGLDAIARGLK
jgi:hypothetical protein